MRSNGWEDTSKVPKKKGSYWLRPEEKSFDVYVDADFADSWNKEDAGDDVSTALSRYGYLTRYMGCPKDIALSSTESEFIG